PPPATPTAALATARKVSRQVSADTSKVSGTPPTSKFPEKFVPPGAARVLLTGPGMDPRIFASKRLHLRLVAYRLHVLLPYGLTPARFDMMYVIEKNDEGFVLQRDLPDILGLGRSTISKMLTLLEGLKLVERTRASRPGRLKVVMLTEEGRRRLHEA